MTLLGKLIIIGFVLLLVILIVDRIYGEYRFVNRDRIFHEECGYYDYEARRLQEYTKRTGLDKKAKKLISPEFHKYKKDPLDPQKRERIMLVFRQALEPLMEFFEENDLKIYNGNNYIDLLMLVSRCYGNDIFK